MSEPERHGPLRTVRTRAGSIEYVDTGGAGPTLVFCHGLLMDHTEWSEVVAALAGFRCICLNLPFGAQTYPLVPEADRSLAGMAAMLGDALDELAPAGAILAINDLGYPLLLVAQRHPRVRAIVVTDCEAWDNLPPGLPGRTLGMAARLPGGLWAATATLRIPGAARLPMTFGWLTRRGLSRTTLRRWTTPILTRAHVRADLLGYIRAASPADLVAACEGLPGAGIPALVLWSRRGRVMPCEHAERLAASLGTQVHWVDDSGVMVPHDQPRVTAAAISSFARAAL
jgi:pimeloyl-ACP methyl ester carboxylesterase